MAGDKLLHNTGQVRLADFLEFIAHPNSWLLIRTNRRKSIGVAITTASHGVLLMDCSNSAPAHHHNPLPGTSVICPYFS